MLAEAPHWGVLLRNPTSGVIIPDPAKNDSFVAMEFDDVVRKRRMIRRFAPDPIPEKTLDDVILAGTRAPSAGFAQGVDLVVLTSESARGRFWDASSDRSWRDRGGSSSGLLAAPAIVIPVDKSDSLLFSRDAAGWPVPYWLVDAAYSSMLILLAATAHDLGSLFFQLHTAEETVCRALDIPDGRRLIGAIAIGFPAGEETPASPSRRARRSFDDVVHRDGW
jgi:nitroreductase